MPSTSNTDSTPVDQQQTPLEAHLNTAEQANICHENTPEYFRREALKKIEELRIPKNSIAELQSSLGLIMKKDDSEKSYIDRMAEWFKKDAFWFEVQSAAVLATGAIALTFAPVALVMASIIASISISLYYLAKFFLIDHYDKTSGREKEISDHIVQMEANVLHSVILLNEAEKQINLMLIALCEINASSAEKLQTFEEQTVILNTQVAGFLKTVHQLEELKNSLIRDNEIISVQLQDAVSKIEESKTDIEQGALRFDSVTKALAETNEALLKSNDELMALHEKFQAKLASLVQMEAFFQEQLTILQHRVAMDDALILAELAMKECHTHMAEIAIYRQAPTHSNASMRFFTSAPSFEAKEYQRPSPSEF